jgi:hypothetical protein
MGGQACVFYGAAEFSRDLDLLVLTDADSLSRLRTALANLDAVPIAVPALTARELDRGHAVHFRCRRADVAGLRIDLMSSLRNMPAFEELWARRTTIDAGGESVDLLSLGDLVRAKKTQRAKDWPMIQRLMEQSYFAGDAAGETPAFWLSELRTPELLIEAAQRFPDAARETAKTRPALACALAGDPDATAAALEQEEREERSRDRTWWEPLRRELEEFRRQRARRNQN